MPNKGRNKSADASSDAAADASSDAAASQLALVPPSSRRCARRYRCNTASFRPKSRRPTMDSESLPPCSRHKPQQICRVVLENGCVVQGASSASRASPKSSAACRLVISHPSLPLPVLRQTDCCTSASHRFQCRLTPLNHPSTPKKNAPSKGDARARARCLT